MHFKTIIYTKITLFLKNTGETCILYVLINYIHGYLSVTGSESLDNTKRDRYHFPYTKVNVVTINITLIRL